MIESKFLPNSNTINIEQALQLPKPLFVDLRSPSEFKDAHIPGAINLPLLDDEERAIVGTIYKDDSPESATEQGFTLAAPKLPQLSLEIKERSKDHQVIVYCWRGGMRSHSVSQLLSILGRPHFRLEGGYKAFRNHVNTFFSTLYQPEIILLCGLTGVGKTEYLQKLRQKDYPAIDLEDLANNRGSVFGHIGLEEPPTQKQFEGRLFLELRRFQDHPRLAVECESQRIGRVAIPPLFFQKMKNGKRVLLYDTLENRIQRLIGTYTAEDPHSKEKLGQAIQNLRKRLGNASTDLLLKWLAEQNYTSLVHSLLLDYYDPLYRYPNCPSADYDFCLDASQAAGTLSRLQKLLSEKTSPNEKTIKKIGGENKSECRGHLEKSTP